MKKLIRILIGAICVSLAQAQDAKKVDFVKEIQPILRENCIKCHGPDKQKGKLRLDSREAAFKGGTDGLVITAGAADKSDLFRRISLPATHDDFMPSKGHTLAFCATGRNQNERGRAKSGG